MMSKDTILHLFSTEKFTDSFVEFVNQNFSMEQHQFFIYGKKNINSALQVGCLSYCNVKYIRDIGIYLKKEKNINEMMKYNKIIVHGLFNLNVINVLSKNRKLCSKTYLYLWGGDFYPCSLNDSIINSWRRKNIIRHAAGIINVLPEENIIVKRLYHSRGREFNAQYWNENIKLYLVDKKYTKNPNGKLKIQVGNSATRSNNHIKILDDLSKFKNEDIEIYVPLSYGDKTYALEVEKYGKKIFGSKFIVLKEYMPLEEYYEFLHKMDVGIFDAERQQALGNIEAHLYFGNIIYVNKKSVPAYHYKKTVGCKIRYTQNLNLISFDKFKYMNVSERNRNIEYIRRYNDKECIITRWKKIFES